MMLWYVRGNNMDINEALQVVNSLFDYLSEIGELDEEDFHRMNEAEDVINDYVRKTAAAYDYAVVLEHPEEMPVITKEQIEQFKEELEQHNKSRCHKCVYEMRCFKHKDYNGNCPDYKRDPPDGGYYG